MKTEWDYTNLAEAYLKRPDYDKVVVEKMLKMATVQQGDKACDIGAGAAHLTLLLAEYGLKINAIEPNDAMRANGIKRTEKYADVEWYEGVGEHTGMKPDMFDIVTFGSSFSVCNRQEALEESNRILKKGGWFACMWNHRELTDPLQKKIEDLLKDHIEGYQYGTRREDQTEVINQSRCFNEVVFLEGVVKHKILAEDFIEGWKSHATVYRQSPEKFPVIMNAIRDLVETESNHQKYIVVPYTTRIWMSQVRK